MTKFEASKTCFLGILPIEVAYVYLLNCGKKQTFFIFVKKAHIRVLD